MTMRRAPAGPAAADKCGDGVKQDCLKDVACSAITDKDGDVPVVWTNTRYRMIYMNMGHGDKVFSSPVQNRLFENEIAWLLRKG